MDKNGLNTTYIGLYIIYIYIYIYMYPVGTGGHYPGSKARLGHDANLSPPFSAKVKNEELYPLSLAPAWQ
jgi:hypothetical protein